MTDKLSEYARRNIHLDYTTTPGAKNNIVNGIAVLEQRVEELEEAGHYAVEELGQIVGLAPMIKALASQEEA